MDLGFEGRVVIVTGGASNIGRAISHEFAKEGATVALLDRDESMAKRTAAEIAAAGGKVAAYTVDLTDVEGTAAAAASVEADLGPVAVLVNNVGWNGTAEFFLDLTPERWDQAYKLNFFPALNATRAVLPKMVERREGAIVSISSDAGFGEFRMADYGGMKAGVMSFTRTIAKEYGRFGIRANTVCPGLVIPDEGAIGEGSLWAKDIKMGPSQISNIESGIPLRRRSEAVDIAWAVLFLASAQARQLSGQVLSVSGGFAMPR
ncbi:MAG: SDR family NAD(P)-dependent oxidoreductase [Acidimicrobiia bacterium]|nr:SDR family NAD(P)-dependent oxidoreductase [Acidimicrobiia bacterium]